MKSYNFSALCKWLDFYWQRFTKILWDHPFSLRITIITDLLLLALVLWKLLKEVWQSLFAIAFCNDGLQQFFSNSFWQLPKGVWQSLLSISQKSLQSLLSITQSSLAIACSVGFWKPLDLIVLRNCFGNCQKPIPRIAFVNFSKKFAFAFVNYSKEFGNS